MTDPIFSPDGKFMWTGSEWIPSPPEQSEKMKIEEILDGILDDRSVRNQSLEIRDSVIMGGVQQVFNDDEQIDSRINEKLVSRLIKQVSGYLKQRKWDFAKEKIEEIEELDKAIFNWWETDPEKRMTISKWIIEIESQISLIESEFQDDVLLGVENGFFLLQYIVKRYTGDPLLESKFVIKRYESIISIEVSKGVIISDQDFPAAEMHFERAVSALKQLNIDTDIEISDRNILQSKSTKLSELSSLAKNAIHNSVLIQKIGYSMMLSLVVLFVILLTYGLVDLYNNGTALDDGLGIWVGLLLISMIGLGNTKAGTGEWEGQLRAARKLVTKIDSIESQKHI